MTKVRGYYSLEEWLAQSPFRQGFILYMEADHPGSPLKGQANPYVQGTDAYAKFKEGEQAAVLLAQDSEE